MSKRKSPAGSMGFEPSFDSADEAATYDAVKRREFMAMTTKPKEAHRDWTPMPFRAATLEAERLAWRAIKAMRARRAASAVLLGELARALSKGGRKR